MSSPWSRAAHSYHTGRVNVYWAASSSDLRGITLHWQTADLFLCFFNNLKVMSSKALLTKRHTPVSQLLKQLLGDGFIFFLYGIHKIYSQTARWNNADTGCMQCGVILGTYVPQEKMRNYWKILFPFFSYTELLKACTLSALLGTPLPSNAVKFSKRQPELYSFKHKAGKCSWQNQHKDQKRWYRVQGTQWSFQTLIKNKTCTS